MVVHEEIKVQLRRGFRSKILILRVVGNHIDSVDGIQTLYRSHEKLWIQMLHTRPLKC